MAIIENQTQWLSLKAANKWMCRQLFLPNMVQHCWWCLVLDSHFLDVWGSTFQVSSNHISARLQVYLLKRGGQTVKLTNAPIRWQRFRISPHIFSSIYFCSCHHFATFQIAFWVKPDLKYSPTSFLLQSLRFALLRPSTNINCGLSCLKISELEHFVEWRFWLKKRGKGNCYESLLSHAPISPLWTDQDWHWAKPRLAKLPAFSILSAKLTANLKIWLKLWLDHKIWK